MLSEKGSLKDTPAIKLLLTIFEEGLSGVLYLKRESLLKVFYFSKGRLSYAVSNSPQEKLENVLTTLQIVAPKNIERVSLSLGSADSLGKALVEKGLLSLEDMINASKVQVKAILLSILRWLEGNFQFVKGNPPDGIMNLDLSITDCILDFVLKSVDFNYIQQELGQSQVPFIKSPDPQKPEKYQLSPKQRELLSGFDGDSTLDEILLSYPDGDRDILKRVIYFFLIAEIIFPRREDDAAIDNLEFDVEKMKKQELSSGQPEVYPDLDEPGAGEAEWIDSPDTPGIEETPAETAERDEEPEMVDAAERPGAVWTPGDAAPAEIVEKTEYPGTDGKAEGLVSAYDELLREPDKQAVDIPPEVTNDEPSAQDLDEYAVKVPVDRLPESPLDSLAETVEVTLPDRDQEDDGAYSSSLADIEEEMAWSGTKAGDRAKTTVPDKKGKKGDMGKDKKKSRHVSSVFLLIFLILVLAGVIFLYLDSGNGEDEDIQSDGNQGKVVTITERKPKIKPRPIPTGTGTPAAKTGEDQPLEKAPAGTETQPVKIKTPAAAEQTPSKDSAGPISTSSQPVTKEPSRMTAEDLQARFEIKSQELKNMLRDGKNQAALKINPQDSPAFKYFKQGDLEAAGRAWKTEIAPSGARYTVLLEMDCLKESVINAFLRIDDKTGFFLLNRDRGSRTCFMVMFGRYADQTEASQALRTLPAYFRQQQHPPVIVGLKQYTR